MTAARLGAYERSHAPVILNVRAVTGAGGGPEHNILKGPKYFHRLGYDVRSAYIRPPDDRAFETLRRRGRDGGAHVIEIDHAGPWDVRAVYRLMRICQTYRVSIWHSHDYHATLLGLIVRNLWPMKLVTTVHGWVYRDIRTPLYYWLDRRCLRYYDQVICVSHDLWQQCRELGVPEERCHLLPNGVELNEAQRSMPCAEAKRAIGAPDGALLVGGMGRLSEEKAFDQLIRASAQLVSQGLDLHLWIAGEGNQRTHLDQVIRASGMSGRARLLGHIPDTATYFQALDVFALSSLREGLPIVLLEAMAFGVPVVATRIAGVPSLIRHDTDGMLVNPGDELSLRTAIARMLRSPGLRSRLADAARQRVEESFSFERRVARVAGVYELALGRAQMAPRAAA